ncbi:MAG: hypothetical protein AMS26_11150 [Bacteroides sp. SM23_62]|nr:MAG: hypothetical protein AMS26_11150 [Bacteroides sp. SM23_62]
MKSSKTNGISGRYNGSRAAGILADYTRYNSRRKPLLSPHTYNLQNFQEAERTASDYNALAEDARQIHQSLADDYKDAFDNQPSGRDC